MTDHLDLAANERPIAALIAALAFEGEGADKLVRLRQVKNKAQTALAQYAAQLDRLYDDVAGSGHDADWIAEAAQTAQQKEAAERESLRPPIEALKKKLAVRRGPDDPETSRLVEDIVAIGEAWLALRPALRERLLQLAAERRAAAEKIRHARPVAGEIDYADLSREHIVRYPKIRAALAN